MKILFFRQNKLKIFLIFVFFIMLLLILILYFGNAINKLAVFSTRLKFFKNSPISTCFKNVEIEKTNLNKKQNSENDESNSNTEQKEEEKGFGPIIRKQYEPGTGSRYIQLEGTAFVRNMTSLPNDVILKANKEKPNFSLETTDEPQVLIYHTHTTESYEPSEKNEYDKSLPTRSKDTKLNVVGIGEEIVKQLKARGIKAIHDTKIYDDPIYSGAYDRTNAMIQSNLKKHPKIKVVLDIHRDSITNQQKERIAPITMINGKKVAQIMIISGCDNGTNHYKNYRKNLSFACSLQKQIEKDFPKLTRPTSFKYKHYNQSLSSGALLVEIGSQANSVEEARLAGMYFGTSLTNALLKLQTKQKEKQNIKPAENKNQGNIKQKNLITNEKKQSLDKKKPKEKAKNKS